MAKQNVAILTKIKKNKLICTNFNIHIYITSSHPCYETYTKPTTIILLKKIR